MLGKKHLDTIDFNKMVINFLIFFFLFWTRYFFTKDTFSQKNGSDKRKWGCFPKSITFQVKPTQWSELNLSRFSSISYSIAGLIYIREDFDPLCELQKILPSFSITSFYVHICNWIWFKQRVDKWNRYVLVLQLSKYPHKKFLRSPKIEDFYLTDSSNF